MSALVILQCTTYTCSARAPSSRALHDMKWTEKLYYHLQKNTPRYLADVNAPLSSERGFLWYRTALRYTGVTHKQAKQALHYVW